MPSRVSPVAVLFATIAGVAVAGLAMPAFADDSPDEAKAKAKNELAKGARYLEAGSYARALAAFEEAYRIFPSPKIFFNIGLAQSHLGHAAKAVRAFDTFLAETMDAPAELVARAKTERDVAQSKVATVDISGGVTGAEILVDDHPAGKVPLTTPLYLDPGTHRIQAPAREGTPPFNREYLAIAGTRDKIELPAAPAPPAVATPRPLPSAQPPVVQENVQENVIDRSLPDHEAERPLYRRPWFWAAAAGVVVAAGLTLWLTVGHSTDYRDASLGRQDLPFTVSR
jgi:hypothetical protein